MDDTNENLNAQIDRGMGDLHANAPEKRARGASIASGGAKLQCTIMMGVDLYYTTGESL